MGISTLSSYCGAQTFEALGLGNEVIISCFDGTASPIGGIGFEELAEDVLARHSAAYGTAREANSLPDYGRVRFRKEGEDHGWAPPIVVALQQAVGGGRTGKTGGTERPEGAENGYENFLAKNAARRPAGPRDLLAVKLGNADSPGTGRTGRRDPPPLRVLRHVPRRPVARRRMPRCPSP